MVPRANIAGTAPAHTNGSAAKFGRRFSGCCSMVSGNISHLKKEKSMGRLVFKYFNKMCSWECRNVEQMHSSLSSFFWRARAFSYAYYITACTRPYNRYLAFLTDWMWEAFGVAGFFFAVAEIIATACRAVFWVQLWCGQHRCVRPLWKLQPTFPEAQWPLVEVT